MQSKVTVPAAGMSSADWDGVDPDIRERSYWTAREGCYARVQGFRDRSQGIVDGNLSEADALREVRAMLRATGYRPEPGTEGTIQDLNSDARQRLILDTNVAMVQGKAYRDSMMGSIAYPAQRLVRERYSRQPRDWAARWRDAPRSPPESICISACPSRDCISAWSMAGLLFSCWIIRAVCSSIVPPCAVCRMDFISVYEGRQKNVPAHCADT